MLTAATLKPEIETYAADELRLLADSVALESVHWPIFEQAGVEVSIRRDDKIHPLASGNKFYKLHHNFASAKRQGLKTLLSFGGAWSNHIYALAALGREQGFQTVGVIRGERPRQPSDMLLDAEAMGMTLHFVTRLEYRGKAALEPALRRKYGAIYIIPEGGANLLGALGCRAMGESLARQEFDAVYLPAATGGTLAGLAAGLADGQKAFAINVLKGDGTQVPDTRMLTRALGNCRDNWQLIDGYHCGGYAKYPAELQDFVQRFELASGLPVEPVYGAKLWWALSDMAAKGVWPQGYKIMVIHTGGLQGRRGYSPY
tara:strand:- start:2142 stop:3089 length:948 start_codon:yes stop_codon:yes gene_type:complete